MSRQVRINFTLVGKSYNVKELEDFSSQSILEGIKNAIRLHFGDRPVLISDEDLVLRKSSYPKYYSAGWFVSDNGIGETGNGSELIVVSHGESMKAAQQDMIKAVSSTDWDRLARNI